MNGSEPILYIWICVTIDAVINFDGDFNVEANAEVTCEQGITRKYSSRMRTTRLPTVHVVAITRCQ